MAGRFSVIQNALVSSILFVTAAIAWVTTFEYAAEARRGRNMPDFGKMTEVEMWLWVENNPGRINALDINGMAILHNAASKGIGNLAIWLIDQRGADVNVKDVSGYTPLHLAHNSYITFILLRRGADPNLASLV